MLRESMGLEAQEQKENDNEKIYKLANNEFIPWIPVTERLPRKPEHDWVLGRIEFKDGKKGVPHIVELRNGVWYSTNLDLPMEDCLGIKVTHWKPIPDEEV